MKIGRLPLLVAVLALVMLAASGPGVRLGLWSFRIGLQMLRWVAYGGIAGGALALLFLLIPKLRAGVAGSLGLALVCGLVALYLPWQWGRQAKSVPAIHDISTDLADPPKFVAILPLRTGALNPSDYGGPEVAAAQRQAYPDIQPLTLALPPDAAFERALAAARDMGWELVASDPAAHRIEATDTTFWFGFKDDVVVRVTAEGAGSRVDVRSLSRVGKSDVGTNAKRIRAYLAKLSA